MSTPIVRWTCLIFCLILLSFAACNDDTAGGSGDTTDGDMTDGDFDSRQVCKEACEKLVFCDDPEQGGEGSLNELWLNSCRHACDEADEIDAVTAQCIAEHSCAELLLCGAGSDGDEPDSDGDVDLDGDMTDGDITEDGDVGDGDTTDGDLTDGDATDGDVADGDQDFDLDHEDELAEHVEMDRDTVDRDRDRSEIDDDSEHSEGEMGSRRPCKQACNKLMVCDDPEQGGTGELDDAWLSACKDACDEADEIDVETAQCINETPCVNIEEECGTGLP